MNTNGFFFFYESQHTFQKDPVSSKWLESACILTFYGMIHVKNCFHWSQMNMMRLEPKSVQLQPQCANHRPDVISLPAVHSMGYGRYVHIATILVLIITKIHTICHLNLFILISFN